MLPHAPPRSPLPQQQRQPRAWPQLPAPSGSATELRAVGTPLPPPLASSTPAAAAPGVGAQPPPRLQQLDHVRCRCETPQRQHCRSSRAASSDLAIVAGGGGGSGGGNSPRRTTGSTGDDGGGAGADPAARRWWRQQQLLAGALAAAALLLPAAPAAAASTVAASKGRGQRGKKAAEAAAALPAWELDAFVDRMWDCSGPILNNMGFSGLMGLCAAAALKWVGRTLAASLGIGLILIQVLSHHNVITVNWGVVHQQAAAVLDRTGDGRLDKDDYKRVVKQGLIVLSEGVPSASGFLVGFLAGLKVF